MTAATDLSGARTTDTGPNVWERRLLLGATVVAVAAVAGIAGAISYGHMHDWAAANGEPPWRALLFPLSVDGLLIAASVVLLADSRAGRHADWLAYLLAGVGASVSVAANVAHDWTDPVAATAIAGWPPLALLGSYELLMRLLRRLRVPAAESAQTGVQPEPVAPTAAEVSAPARPTGPSEGRRQSSAGRSPARTRRTSPHGSAGRDKARALWQAERAAGRTPSGADLAREADVDASLGRRWRREWLRDDNPSNEVTAETTGESRTDTYTANDSETETAEEAA